MRDTTSARARRFEEIALLRADRYPYDSQDGVHAVHFYRMAAACYRMAAAPADAERARRAASELLGLVNTDYAAARLSFANALDSERWSTALAELRRLIRLTEHLGEHEYVGWLEDKIGGLEVRVRTDS